MAKIAIIPARAGSQRLPDKNIQKIGDYTLIALALRCAKETGIFDKIILTTDIPINLIEPQEELADVYMVERPPELALANTSSWRAIDHAAKECGAKLCMDSSMQDKRQEVLGSRYTSHKDWICLLQPTSPFRSPDDIKMLFLCMEHAPKLEKFYTVCNKLPHNRAPNGAVYIVPFGNYGFGSHETTGSYMPPERSIDIDTEYDLNHARALFAYEKENPGTFDIWHPSLR